MAYQAGVHALHLGDLSLQLGRPLPNPFSLKKTNSHIKVQAVPLAGQPIPLAF